jgi:hypothetical protein
MQITICIVMLIALAALGAVFWTFPKIAYAQAQTALNSQAIEALQQAREDLIASGVPEKDIPPALNIPANPAEVDVDSIIKAAAASVLAQIRNDPAYRGQDGVMGLPGAPCDPNVNPACVGPKGDDSDVPGPAGADSTVPGPKGDACLSSNPECVGPAGKDAPTPQSASFVTTENGCMYRTVYSDGSSVDAAVSPSMCF